MLERRIPGNLIEQATQEFDNMIDELQKQIPLVEDEFSLKNQDYPLNPDVLADVRSKLIFTKKISPEFYKEVSTLVEKYISQSQDSSITEVISGMNLLENPRFKAFVVDVSVNTCDLSNREGLPNYEVKHLERSLEEILEENLPRVSGLSEQ